MRLTCGILWWCRHITDPDEVKILATVQREDMDGSFSGRACRLNYRLIGEQIHLVHIITVELVGILLKEFAVVDDIFNR